MPAYMTLDLVCDCKDGHHSLAANADGRKDQVRLELKYVPSGPLKGRIYFEGIESMVFDWPNKRGRWLITPFDPIYGGSQVTCPLHNPEAPCTTA